LKNGGPAMDIAVKINAMILFAALGFVGAVVVGFF
jgi:hypothetical protein